MMVRNEHNGLIISIKSVLILILSFCTLLVNAADVVETNDAVITTNQTLSQFHVYKKNLTITNATVTVTGKLIVEGDLIMNNSTLIVDVDAIISIIKHLKGTGGVLEFRSQNKNRYGTIAILQGIEGNGVFHIDRDGNKSTEISYGSAFYIDGTTIDGQNLSNSSSQAYSNSTKIIEEATSRNLLPIELTSFKATATNNGFVFNWVTASEENNDYFTLEYSIDGVNFNAIDYVHGAGTTSETSEYEYRWDEAPDFEMLYFRLKQTDYNGEYSYSDVLVSSRKKSSGANGTFRYGPLNFKVVDGQLQYIVK